MDSYIREYLDRKICVLKNNWHQIPPEFQEEFNKESLKINLFRSKIVAVFLLIATIPLLYIDYLNYQGGLWVSTPGYQLLFYSHVLLALVMLIPLIIIPAIRPRDEYRAYHWQKTSVVLFFFLFLIVTVIISVADQRIHGEITAYIMGVLGFAAIIYLKPATSLLAYLLSFALFIAGVSQMQADPEILKGHYINSAFLIMIGWLFSVTLYNTRLSDFLNRKGLEFYANFDYLTGCFNRRAFIHRLQEEIERARRDQSTISIVLVDIDLFKQVNDKFGHSAGDLVLKQLIDCFNKSCRKYDFIGRFGGEEFIICLPNTGLRDASEIAERFRGIIENTKMTYDSNTISITVSLGVAALEPTHHENIDKFISRADSAMYRAKTKRNQVCLSTI